MGIKLVVAVTDYKWFDFLRQRQNIQEINFWSPSSTNFRALQPGEMLLFKLHAPYNKIAGCGIFTYANNLPCSVAWEIFKEGNGVDSAQELYARIKRYRTKNSETSVTMSIGCRILAQPFYFTEDQWIDVPEDWKPNIVSYKTYDTDEHIGLNLWRQVQDRIRQRFIEPENEKTGRYGKPHLVSVRIGQAMFRVKIIEAYNQRCAVTQERTLPALEAAHIMPYSAGGSHDVSNGLLLRRDIHSLFDAGYVTVTPKLKFEVSKSIRKEFTNGKDYYALHGKSIVTPEVTSKHLDLQPNRDLLTWHNDNCFQH